MKLRWWHIVGILIAAEIISILAPIALLFAFVSPGLIILIGILGLLITKAIKRRTRSPYEDVQTEADMQDLDNEMYEVESMLDQMQKVGHINDELDEIEAVLDQLSGTEQADRKIIPIWDLPKKP